MKNVYIYLTMAIFILFLTLIFKYNKSQSYINLIKNNMPREELLELLNLLEIKHDGTLEGINNLLQKKQSEGGFMRDLGKERLDLQETFPLSKKIMALELLKKMNFIDEVPY